MQTDSFPEIVRELYRGEQSERDAALLRLAEDVCSKLVEHYSPPTPPERLAPLRGLTLEDLREKLKGSDFSKTFGEWRDAVLQHEERCAGRLEILQSTANTLMRLESRQPDPARVWAMLDQLGRHAAERWRQDLPARRDPGWALKVSRRYDLLPPSWRTVSAPPGEVRQLRGVGGRGRDE